jgi:chaperonin cofactor prefoldin
MDEGGLMGEFAKNKINELIKYLNNVESEIKTIQEAQNIINIIGEPVLKSILQNMLDEKYSTNTKLDKLKSEKARLEKEIQKLEFEGKLDE